MVGRLVEQQHVGRATRACASATRLTEPPESSPMRLAPSRRSWASVVCTRCSQVQAPSVSMRVCKRIQVGARRVGLVGRSAARAPRRRHRRPSRTPSPLDRTAAPAPRGERANGHCSSPSSGRSIAATIPQQRGLARAVAPDQRQPLAALEREARPSSSATWPKGEVGVLKREQGHAAPAPAGESARRRSMRVSTSILGGTSSASR